MRFVTYSRAGGAPEAGVLRGERVVGLAEAGYPDLIGVAAKWPEAKTGIEQWLKTLPESAGMPASDVKMLAPIPRPSKIVCVGLNYRDHAIESNMAIPQVPTIFNKFTTAVIGPNDPIVLPAKSEKPDYEAEFAFVIGMGGRHIPAEQWSGHVFGYTIVNDVSARDYQMATSQWMIGKTFDTFCPMGPHIVSADEIADPHALDISLTIGGETLQSSNTRELIFKIPDLIAYLSSVFTLEPGDIVSTGTPAGVGFARKPPRFLKAGEVVVAKVAGIGELRNSVVAEGAA